MDFDENSLEDLLNKVVKNMFEKEPNIFGFSIHSASTEWNLCHHLAIQLGLVFPEYNCDVEVIHVESGRTRPDIIIHKRGEDDNFLVVESKLEDSANMEDDFDKIVSNYFIKPYFYKFGAVVNFSRNGTSETSVSVFPND